jgi:hypothetical protein
MSFPIAFITLSVPSDVHGEGTFFAELKDQLKSVTALAKRTQIFLSVYNSRSKGIIQDWT